MDSFAEDRQMFERLGDILAEIGTELGEWFSDNAMGDPSLRDALVLAHAAEGAVRAAHVLCRQARKTIPRNEEDY